uniref:NADH-ubiquinone oxidoreductase chain 3 n=1 Tax=Globodera rostochiensis TaxID=31243 RepID=B2WS64_GLORO|nr:NADH-ubiquinone oxidoreductase subunit 3 [Globodera rostochiensis]
MFPMLGEGLFLFLLGFFLFFLILLLSVFYFINFLFCWGVGFFDKLISFESGFSSLGKINIFFSLHFFLVLLIFVLFDLEFVLILFFFFGGKGILILFFLVIFFIFFSFFLEWFLKKLVWAF